jgi:3-hydroxybutyryl-CoA dehydratase
MQKGDVQTLTIEDIEEGQRVSFTTTIDEVAIDAFADLTGDISPLHMDADFARGRGFERRVAHGALLGGYVSRLFGVHMPGRNCLLQSLRLTFQKPAYAGDEIEVEAEVAQLSPAVSVMVAKVTIRRVADGERLASGQAQIGFTAGATDGDG